jgi:hypothetical protein
MKMSAESRIAAFSEFAMSIEKSLVRSTARLPHRLFALSLLLIATISGCNETTREAVLGRWFNGDMSLRLRKDGSVVWNTRQGLAQGRYKFIGDVPRWATENTTVRLQLDVVRNGQPLQPMLDLQFIGGERVRVGAVSQGPVRAADRAHAILRRAAGAEASADTIAPSKRSNTGIRSIQ